MYKLNNLSLGNGVFADDMERGIRPFVQFVGIVADKEYTIQCTDAGRFCLNVKFGLFRF